MSGGRTFPTFKPFKTEKAIVERLPTPELKYILENINVLVLF